MSYSSYAEYLRTPTLMAVKKQVAERSCGQCELCGRSPATEYHHVRYCAWGQYDPPENLLHVCHDCHCDCHRCRICRQVELKAYEIKRKLKVCRTCRR